VSTRNTQAEYKAAASIAKQVHKVTDELLNANPSGETLESQIKIFPVSQFPDWGNQARIDCLQQR
jgi:hypothetical protein